MITQFLIHSDCYRTGRTITPKGVMVHSTGANNPRLSRYLPGNDIIGWNRSGNHWDRSGVNACVHGFIGRAADGSVQTVQTLPWEWRGWHAGKGSKGSANNTHISFEICEDDLSDPNYFRECYNQAVALTAYLCKRYKLDPLADGVVICHSEGNRRGVASNHADVMHWFPKYGKDMDQFRREVKKAMEEKRYNTVAELPEYAKEPIQWYIDNEYLSGTGAGLELSGDMMRLLVIAYRAFKTK